MKRQIALVHTSPAAITPLMRFYGEAAPELEITNLLDDGILRFFAAGQAGSAERQLAKMIEATRQDYGAELALLTCSSVSGEMKRSLSRATTIPVLKIDEPMARAAVQAGNRIGVAVTFTPTLKTTLALLDEAAAEAGREIEMVPSVAVEAYQALLTGDNRVHDELLVAAVGELERQRVDVIVLAQVSMARVLAQLHGRVNVQVLSSLHTSLAAVREALGELSSSTALTQ